MGHATAQVRAVWKSLVALPVRTCRPVGRPQVAVSVAQGRQRRAYCLRQYFPKGTDLSVHTAAHLAAVADELNTRPRKTLNWDTPAQTLARLLAS